MKTFLFLEKNPYFQRKFDSGHHVFYYYGDYYTWHARIDIPKNSFFDYGSFFYVKNKLTDLYEPAHIFPIWFQELVQSSVDYIYMRDRIRRLSNGQSNSFYENTLHQLSSFQLH